MLIVRQNKKEIQNDKAPLQALDSNRIKKNSRMIYTQKKSK